MERRVSRRYAARLVREAEANPDHLLENKKFWKVDFFYHYLRHAEKLIWQDPNKALRFLEPAPEFAARIAAANATANGADLLILAHAYLGNAHRKVADTPAAEEQFTLAARYRLSASPEALGGYLQLFTTFCIAQRSPEAFNAINEAIDIYKRGDLVNRNNLGRCLVRRGIAYYRFDQPDKVLTDFTAALNHLSIAEDPISYYCALHNLTCYSVLYGTDNDVAEALSNLKPARVVLRGLNNYPYATLGMRYLMALFDFRLGRYARAELAFQQIVGGFYRLKLPFDIGLAQLDLARLYLVQGSHEKLRVLVKDTARLFHELGNDTNAQQALNLWRQAFHDVTVTEEHLLATREEFFSRKTPMAK